MYPRLLTHLIRLILPAAALVIAGCAPSPTATPRPMPTAVPLPTPTATAALAAAVKNLKPVIQILSPANGSVLAAGSVAEVVSISADPNGLERVDLLANEQVLGSTPANGQKLYHATQQWTPSQVGEQKVAVVAYDSAGIPSAYDIATVTVVAVPAGGTAPTAAPTATGDSDPPAVSITPDPTDGVVGEEIDVYVNAVDANGVVKLELYIDDELEDTYDVPDTGSPQQSVFNTFTWRDPDEGQHDIYVKAYDPSGNVGQSPTEKVTVSAAPSAATPVTPSATATPGG